MLRGAELSGAIEEEEQVKECTYSEFPKFMSLEGLKLVFSLTLLVSELG